jgi:hypothetical protein
MDFAIHRRRDSAFNRKPCFCTQKLPQSAANADQPSLVGSLELSLLLLGRPPSISRARPRPRRPILARTALRRRTERERLIDAAIEKRYLVRPRTPMEEVFKELTRRCREKNLVAPARNNELAASGYLSGESSIFRSGLPLHRHRRRARARRYPHDGDRARHRPRADR